MNICISLSAQFSFNLDEKKVKIKILFSYHFWCVLNAIRVWGEFLTFNMVLPYKAVPKLIGNLF